MKPAVHRAAWPAAIFAICAAVYSVGLGERAMRPDPWGHYAYLAAGWLRGELSVGTHPPTIEDWACFDIETKRPCPPGAFSAPQPSHRWYVTFPPFPAVLLLPWVALFGTTFWSPVLWAVLAGLAPALLFVLLRRLREQGASHRTFAEDLSLVIAFAFGSMLFVAAVQGTVWYAAHVVASILLVLFLLAATGARYPLLAGAVLGCLFLTRPTTLLFGLYFLVEALWTGPDAPDAPNSSVAARSARRLLWAATDAPTRRRLVLFVAPVGLIGAAAAAYNLARFDQAFEFGHRFLQVHWQATIEKWGLFNYHYLSRNLAVVLTSLPWISGQPPYLTLSRHGLALWVTSPWLLWALWPRRFCARTSGLSLAVLSVALFNFFYQSSGWTQFGYRYSLDYLPGIVLLIALGGRPLGNGFRVALGLSIAIHLFGVVTFERGYPFTDPALSRGRYFQPH